MKSKRVKKTGFCCLTCEKWFAELEDADICEASHEKPQRERERYDDDGVEYADPRDFRDGLE